MSPPVGKADIPRLCAALAADLPDDEAVVVVCDVGAVVKPDAVTIDALARLQLTAKRAGCRMELQRAGPRLRALLALTGMGGVLPCHDASS